MAQHRRVCARHTAFRLPGLDVGLYCLPCLLSTFEQHTSDIISSHGILLSHKKRNEIGSFVEMWMDLESVIQMKQVRKRKTNIVYQRIYVESKK